MEFPLVREKLAGYTTFPLAGEMALDLLPSYERDEVVRRQEETGEARRFLERGASLNISDARDLGMALRRAQLGGTLAGEELRGVYDTLRVTREARAAVLRQTEMPILSRIARDLPVIMDMEQELAKSIGRSGEVLDSASPALRELRAETRAAYQRLADSLDRTMRRMQRNNILQEPIITQRNGRMVLLVKTEMRQRLPGIVHDVSDSGATLFVEPMAAIGLGNRWRELRLSEEREEERVLRALSARVGDHSDDLLLGLDLLARLDLAMAKGRYSADRRAVAPVILPATPSPLGPHPRPLSGWERGVRVSPLSQPGGGVFVGAAGWVEWFGVGYSPSPQPSPIKVEGVALGGLRISG
jgi:DNA mismatch repair protein MutS2